MLRTSLASLLLGAAFGVAQADTLLIDGIEMAEASGAERPASGQSKAEVEARFGEPLEMVAAVGDPPISSWRYPGFTVYFEGDLVLHAVVRR